MTGVCWGKLCERLINKVRDVERKKKKKKKLTKKTTFCYFFSLVGLGRRGPWEQCWFFIILALTRTSPRTVNNCGLVWFPLAVKMAAQRGKFVPIAASQTVGITYGLFFLYLIATWVIQERRLHRVQRRVLDLCLNAGKMTTSPLHQVRWSSINLGKSFLILRQNL